MSNYSGTQNTVIKHTPGLVAEHERSLSRERILKQIENFNKSQNP